MNQLPHIPRLAQRPPLTLPRMDLLFDDRARYRNEAQRPGTPAAKGTSAAKETTAVTGTYETGLLGEDVVADGLRRGRWTILGHRVRTKVGEIDLIARRGDTVIFVEVKTAGPRRRAVEESVTPRARHRIRRAAVAWMSLHPQLHRGVRRYRFDVFFVFRKRDGSIDRVEQIRDAF